MKIFKTTVILLFILVLYENDKECQFKKDEKGNWQLDGKTLKQEEMDNLLDSIVLLQINGLDEGKNVVSADRPFAFDVYGKDKVERISFAKKDENNEYVLIDGKSIGQYVSLKDINSIKNNLDKLIK